VRWIGHFPLAGLVGGDGAVGEDETGDARRSKMVDDVLDLGEVGVALRWHTILPALLIAQPLAAPVAHVKRRVGKGIVGFEEQVAFGSG
jgi:hypothetical protein